MTVRAFWISSFSILWMLLTSPVNAYKTVGFRWASEAGPIVYQLEAQGSDDIDDGSDLQRVEEAFKAWGCVEGSNLRFVRGLDLPERGYLGDGKSSVFWIEEQSGLTPYGLTENNLAVTMNNVIIEQGATVENQETDIMMNGFHFQWNSEGSASGNSVPIFPVLLSHIGTLVGLGQSCESAEDPACPGEENTVLKWYYDYGAEGPLADDQSGVQSLYPADDDSTCNGPFRQGERCATNCDCLDGMVCIPGAYGYDVCAPPCSSAANDCPYQFACLFGAKDEDDVAHGTCLQVGTQRLRTIGSYCEVDTQCENNSCLAVASVGRSICRQACSDDGDCDENTQCTEGVCLGSGPLPGIPCADGDSGCGCSAISPTPLSERPFMIWGILFVLLATARRWRSRPSL